ncbi:DUF2690 domain-containing protein [Actinoalloteichus sp. AHMU CJ021]|uniref:DUF2690 domain-containing protein n=1 Tax=Actinoalloteichus caeruleus DSM 43889 TaxID=1120930 RepID=A0ABT1JPT8_ACTCY|nr:DUF2690 domain-containing protein [Actinoalloteichus caeruleus]AUS80305.1 DUF2690 domain-containing protein [Actinoalloteichus sp. AHMU CJ021]MCP2334555.1 Protein of unknown function (DUF2690) [Actinoalloteichus caeruleus DSM 43889]
MRFRIRRQALVIAVAVVAVLLTPTAQANVVDPPPGALGMSAPACSEEDCLGQDPLVTRCASDAYTPKNGWRDLAGGGYLEHRYSPRCHASWTRVSRSTNGDVISVENTQERRHGATIATSGVTEWTGMVPNRWGLDEARACAFSRQVPTCTDWY